METVLSVSNLSVAYDKHLALDALTMELCAGEIVGLIGPNGAGKTSFIKSLCGRLGNATGDISIGGQTLSHGQSRQKLIGLVPQDIGLYPHMTAAENLMAFARIMKLSRGDAKTSVTHVLEAVDLTHKANEPVSALSGGMKRRINVAAAIMHDPKLIIMDEPTAGVDIPARDSIHRLARKLAESGLGVLLVTHELEQAEALCDRILLLVNGRKLAYGKPSELLNHCYKGAREVMVRFSQPPNERIRAALAPHKFAESELPTIWTAMTDTSEIDFVESFMKSFHKGGNVIREISVRRPGLPSLMHHIEKTGGLPC